MTLPLPICELLPEQIGGLYSCVVQGDKLRVRTPFIFPDGDVIDLYAVTEGGGGVTLTDFGTALQWLRMQTTAKQRAPRQTQLLQEICTTHGVEVIRGVLSVRVPDRSRAVECLHRLAQAMVRVADLAVLSRSKTLTEESFAEKVAQLLKHEKITSEPDVSLTGASGELWSVDFRTRTAKVSAAVFLLPGSSSRTVGRRTVEHTVAALVDLRHLHTTDSPLQFVSLFDDTDADVPWRGQDFKQLEKHSKVARWSSPQGFLRLLAA